MDLDPAHSPVVQGMPTPSRLSFDDGTVKGCAMNDEPTILHPCFWGMDPLFWIPVKLSIHSLLLDLTNAEAGDIKGTL